MNGMLSETVVELSYRQISDLEYQNSIHRVYGVDLTGAVLEY